MKLWGKDKDHLEYRLWEKTTTCDQLKQEFETLTENHLSDFRIKKKIIEKQNKIEGDSFISIKVDSLK